MSGKGTDKKNSHLVEAHNNPGRGSVTCLFCGEENPETFVYCASCGSRISQLCPHCKDFHPAGKEICPCTGKPITVAKSARERGRKIRKSLAASACAAVIAGTIMLYAPAARDNMYDQYIQKPIRYIYYQVPEKGRKDTAPVTKMQPIKKDPRYEIRPSYGCFPEDKLPVPNPESTLIRKAQ